MERTFEQVAMNEKNERWEQMIHRERELYQRKDDIRSPFLRDYTRVLHSLAYRRLKHKTQVFYNAAGNDHICTRIEHVAHVESVSNSIARELGLNEELTKAIAMAHDLGHAPFGHHGEKVINELTKTYLGKTFWHEKNGVYFVDKIELLKDYENMSRNLDLTYAVRDGIISHCGEVDQNGIKPRKECFDLNHFERAGQYEACTWEGCVVKLADKIAYLGRDIEDAIRLKYLSREQQNMLLEMAKVNNDAAMNTTVIMHNMIIDLCKNSSVEHGLRLSDSMAEQLKKVKDFNYQYIYSNRRLDAFVKYSELIIKQLFETLFSYYYGADTVFHLMEMQFDRHPFVRDFVEWLVRYCENDFSKIEWAENIVAHSKNEKIYGTLALEEQYTQAVIDYIAGMTDVYAIHAFNQLLEC